MPASTDLSVLIGLRWPFLEVRETTGAGVQVERAEREGFEPSRQGITPPTRFPVALLKPLGHLSGEGESGQSVPTRGVREA
jgi:hypothetical protein